MTMKMAASVAFAFACILIAASPALASPEPEPEFSGPGAEFDCSPLQYIASRDDLSILNTFFEFDTGNFPFLYESPPDADTVYTFFLPNDAAFEAVFSFFNASLDDEDFFPTDEADQQNFNSFLFYHVIPNATITSSDLPGLTATVPTFAGATPWGNPNSTLSVIDGVITPEGGSPLGPPTPIEVDIPFCSAIYHIIDLPLFSNPANPPEQSIVSVASGVDDLSTLVEFVVFADLVEALSDSESQFTVFAPTNAAFEEALGIFGFNCTTCGPPGGPSVNGTIDVLSYHVIPSAALTAGDLVDGQVLTTLNPGVGFPPGATEVTVDILDDGTVTIVGARSTATVIQADVAAGDSFVHVVDTVLLPFSPADFATGPEPEPEPICVPFAGRCETNEECCTGTCRGPTFRYPFYRRCTFF